MISKNDKKYLKTSLHGKKSTKAMCCGCEDNFYNGNNPFDVKECMRFENAVVVKRKQVNVNMIPPWTMKAIQVPSCYRVKGYVFINPKMK